MIDRTASVEPAGTGAGAVPSRRPIGRRVLRTVLGLMLATGAAFAGWRLWDDASLADLPSDVRLLPLVLAFALSCSASATHPPLWLALYRGLGGRLAVRDAYRIYLVTMLGKYVPGKVLLVAGRVAMLRDRGEPAAVAVTSTALEVLLTLLAATIAAVVCVPALLWEWGLADRANPAAWALLLALPAGLVGLHPRVLGPSLRLAARLVPGRTGAMPTRAPSYRVVLLVASGHLLQRVVGGCGLLAVTWSVHPLGVEWLPFLMGTAAISHLVAFSVPIAPAGLGIREGVMGLLLATAMPAPAAAIVTVLSRVLNVSAELGAAGIAVAARSDARDATA